MALVTLTRVDDEVSAVFLADENGVLPAGAVLVWAGTSEVRVSTIYDNGNATNTADAVQATLADMPPLDLTSSPLRIEYKAATDLEATITDAITDAIIVTADETGVWHYVADVAAGAFTVQSAIGFKERAILAADTPASDVTAVKNNMRAAWGAADTGQRLGIDTAAVAVNVAATLSGGGVYNVEWGDGSASIGVASGVAATHTYSSPFAGDVVIRYPAATPLTEILSTAGAWAFDLSDLAASVTSLTLTNTLSAITGSISDNSTLTSLQLNNTLSSITGSISTNSTLIDLRLNATSSVITGDIGSSSTLTVLSLADTTSTITGDTPFDTSGNASVFNLSGITPGYSTAVVDAILISLANETNWAASKSIDLSGTHDPRSSASDAAVSTLNGLGVTVTTSPAIQALGINTAAVAVNVTATVAPAATYDVDWGDGGTSLGVASGATATHTYAAPYNGDVLIDYAGGALTEISSTAGAWSFDLSDLAASVTSLILNSTSSVITGSISDNSTLTYLNLNITPSVITGDIGDNSTLTFLNLINTSSVITGDIGDNATLTVLRLNTTSSVITGDIGDNSMLTYLDVYNTSSTITGDIGDNSTLTFLALANTPSVITGDIGDNSTLTYLNLAITSSTITGGTPFNTSGSARLFDLANITPGYSTAVVDAIIISLAAETTWSSEKLINLSGTHDPRSSASDAAVSTLNGLGVTVTTSP